MNMKFWSLAIIMYVLYNIKLQKGTLFKELISQQDGCQKVVKKMWTKLTYSFLNSKLKISTNKMLILFMSYGIFKLFIKYYKS